MLQEKKPVLFILLFAGIILFIFLLMQPIEVIHFNTDIALLFPEGLIALKERNLLFIIQILMLLVVIPVYLLTFAFSWKYRADNPKGKYTPDWNDSPLAEFIWWGVPFLLILVIGILTWIKTYELDPHKPLDSNQSPLKIQVVALQWKWLFLYPEEEIATLNFVQFPEKKPIHFEITADAPMNSFWIPKLGSQIYAMPKMKTQLHLIADAVGEYRGCSANLSGDGFADMHFIAKASHQEDFDKWVEQAENSSQELDWEGYKELCAPTSEHKPQFYHLKDKELFEKILMKYMHPTQERE